MKYRVNMRVRLNQHPHRDVDVCIGVLSSTVTCASLHPLFYLNQTVNIHASFLSSRASAASIAGVLKGNGCHLDT